MAHILVVEDQMLVAMLFQAVLEGEGHRVTLAGDGIAALEADAADPADLLLTDRNMPRMTGIELVHHLRVRRPGLPVILVSGDVDGQFGDGEFANESSAPPEPDGTTALLDKPVSPRVLTRALSDLLSNREKNSPGPDGGRA